MVKLVKLFVALAFLHFNVQGGENSIVFDSTGCDFGTVESAQGTLRHSFRFLNSGSSTVFLAAPVPGCSCISASLSPREVLPGQTGTVEVALDLSGVSGYAMRTVGIFTRGGEEVAALSLSAIVRGAGDGIDELCPVALTSALRASRREIPFGYIYDSESAPKKIKIVNVSSKPLPLKLRCSNPGLQVSAPALLVPGEVAELSMVYVGPGEDWTSSRDTIIIDAGGEPGTLMTSCIRLRSEEDKGAKLRTCPSVGRLHRVPLSREYKGSIELYNDGSSALVIHAVRGGADSNLKPGTVLLPGSVLEVGVRTGRESETLEIFTNDPKRPYKELIYKH